MTDVRPMASPVVFFDFGGTLVEAWPDLRPIFRAAGAQAGVEVDWDAYLRANDVAWEALWPQAPAWVGRRPSFADEVHARALRAVGFEGPVEPLVAALREAATSVRWHRPFPDAEEVLAALRARHIPVHLVSNNVDFLPITLENLGWGRTFGSVTYSQEIAVAKPDPRLFRLALDRAGCAAEDATFVGDTWATDVVGAQRAGLRPVWLDRSAAAARPGVPTIHDLRELLPLLEPR